MWQLTMSFFLWKLNHLRKLNSIQTPDASKLTLYQGFFYLSINSFAKRINYVLFLLKTEPFKKTRLRIELQAPQISSYIRVFVVSSVTLFKTKSPVSYIFWRLIIQVNETPMKNSRCLKSHLILGFLFVFIIQKN